MSDIINRARELRAVIEQAAETLTNDEALHAMELFPTWHGDGRTYKTGERLRHNGELYSVLLDHTSQADWQPDEAASLFAKVLTDPNGGILPWVQPDSANPYMIDDKVTHNGQTWVSNIDNNVWEPGVYGWVAVIE